jgi:uncharacterized protein
MKIKFILTAFFLQFLFIAAFSQSSSDLIISEYVEGSGNNKAIEFYNGTATAINLTSGNYVVQYYFNGSATAGTTIILTGTIATNGVFVLANASASFAASSFVNQTNNSTWYNGDDAIVLRKGGASGEIIDAIGQVGFDPGTEWGTGLVSTADNTIRRKFSTCSGDVNQTNIFDPSVEWDGFATDNFSGLGTHTSSCSSGGQPIVINSAPLNFTGVVGTTSTQQSYTIQATGLVNDITITVPALSDFGIALSTGGPYNSSITVPVAVANAAPVVVYVIFTPQAAGLQSGNITHESGAASANLTVQGTASAAGGTTRIYEIQGFGAASPFVGSAVTTEGIVTGNFQNANQLNGFFIQDTTGDANNLTSDGIFIFDTAFKVTKGDYVRLTGSVAEVFAKTEIKSLTALSVLSSGNTIINPVDINLPVAAITDMERYEGMLVRFPQTLTVSETFTLGRFGEAALSANGRLFNPTNFVDPNDNPASGNTSGGTSNIAAVAAQQDLNNRSRILLDDGSAVQNPSVVPYLNPADTTLRTGSTISSLTGNLDFDFNVYRLQPTITPAFNYAPRPAVPSVGSGNIKISSFNVLNYFNGDGTGGGFPTSRGANTLIEFNRQRTKIIAAIKGLNASVTGLTEIENDGDGTNSAIADLVNGLNAATAPGTFAYINDPAGANGNTGTDEIKVAIIYKPAIVTPQGPAVADINPVHNRPPLAQTFAVNGTAEKFTVVVNHFKSKGCSGATGLNTDQLDGQGCFNNSRKLQAAALLGFIDTVRIKSGDQDIVTVGDYNAYEEEDPIDILRAGGLINAVPGAYSYVFSGQSGALDYAFTTPSLNNNITGADKWHINADEPVAKDYNQEFNPAYTYSADAYRSSDHDPVLLGLKFGNAAPSISISSPANNSSFNISSTILLTASAADADGTIARVEFYNNGIKFSEDSIAPYTFTGNETAPGSYAVTAKATDNEGAVSISDTVKITVTECNGSGSITAEGYANIPGSQVADLTGNAAYPNNPSVTASLNIFEYGNYLGDNYGARVRGYICAPQTGDYIFYIAADDQAGLWLSSDENPANKILIAYTEAWTNLREWFKFPSQKSVTIRLVKGGRYYIETLHKELNGTDHLAVAWALPDGSFEGPVNGNRLSPVTLLPSGGRIADFNKVMELKTAGNNTPKGLKVTVTPNPSPNDFIMVTKSGSDKPLTINVFDVSGRIAERKSNIAANGTVRIGNKLPAGIYLIEIIQGTEKQRLKLVKQ